MLRKQIEEFWSKLEKHDPFFFKDDFYIVADMLHRFINDEELAPKDIENLKGLGHIKETPLKTEEYLLELLVERMNDMSEQD